MSGWIIGAGIVAYAAGTAMQKKGKGASLSSYESSSMGRKSEAEGELARMFHERAKNPFQYVMGLEEQKYYDQRQSDIYGEERGQQQQSLMSAMSRTGTLGSGATNYNLMRFGQQTLRDRQQASFQDRANRLNEKEAAIQNTYNMGLQLVGAPTIGGRATQMENQNRAAENAWTNRWATGAQQVGGMLIGYGLGNKGGGGGGGTAQRPGSYSSGYGGTAGAGTGGSAYSRNTATWGNMSVNDRTSFQQSMGG